MEDCVSSEWIGGMVERLSMVFSNVAESIIIAGEPSSCKRAVAERAFVGDCRIQ